MKYIRTKDGVYEVIEECFKPMENNMVLIPREGLTKILKQADTIEELCDEFVIKFNDEENHIEVYKQMRKDDLGWAFNDIHNMPQRHISPLYLNNPFEIYGAIWTDKGLIYVAKMNKKGELELL